ncbi:glycosyltransferase family 2 protein [Streptococcus pseudopneumoniae]|jgi:capsular polysaccharide biosynthesis protein cpsJ|uniref:glycosyltransferase family 2 protein n=1 Tax=Streptococcus pseudopneumoniae TaxID=257758 RepID=UPI00066DF2CE|nr:glycosyltransferase family 2 protein [Streptococcus pseudopneumoniae]
MEKISVIVPVYMSEAYLEKCLDSILQQTYQNLEVILINDGSTDGSAAICQRYKNQDARVKVYHKPNGGVASSRNRALEAVTGDYIVFVDNDDWLELDHIQSLYDLLKKTDADIAIGNFTQFIEDQGSFLIHVGADNYFEQVYSPFDWFHHQYDSKYNLSQCFTVPWAKLYKAELFKDIVYPTDQKVEDDYTTYKVYLQADKIAYMNKAIYIHRKRSTSVTRTVNLADVYPLKSIEERLTILNLIGAPQQLLDKEIQAYKWRLSIHEEESLKRGDMEAYQQILVKKAIESKQR